MGMVNRNFYYLNRLHYGEADDLIAFVVVCCKLFGLVKRIQMPTRISRHPSSAIDADRKHEGVLHLATMCL